MHRYPTWILIAFLGVFILSACAPAAAPAVDNQPPPAQPTDTTQPPAPTVAEPTSIPTPASTATPEPSVPPGPAGVYRVGVNYPCDALLVLQSCGTLFTELVMQTLAAPKWNGEGLQPLLAERWELENGGKSVIYYLRQDVKWHDGTPFTADDVIFSLELYSDFPDRFMGTRGLFGNVIGYAEKRDGSVSSLSGVTRIDDYTVKIDIAGQWRTLTELHIPRMVVLPAHLLSEEAALSVENVFWEKPVGTGPFIISEHEKGESVTAVANPDYFLGKPKLDKIEITVYRNLAQAFEDLENGELDAYPVSMGGGIPMDRFEQVKTWPHVTTVNNRRSNIELLVNLNDPLLQDARVRQAMLYAIDREKILTDVYKDNLQIANTIFAQDWAIPDTLNPYNYDPELAKQLLTDAGWNFDTELHFISDDSLSMSVDQLAVEAVVADLTAVGMKINLVWVGTQEFELAVGSNQFQIVYGGEVRSLDPIMSTALLTCGNPNAYGYCNEELDFYMQAGANDLDRAARAVSYHKVAEVVNEELPRIWLWYGGLRHAYNNRIAGPVEHFAEQPLVLFGVPVYYEVHTWETRN